MFSNFVTLDRFSVADTPLSHFVSHVNIVRSSCRHVWRLWPRLWYLRGIRSAQLTNCTQFFSFQWSYGWSRLARSGTRSSQGALHRLKSVDGMSSGSHVRKTNTPFFACTGMRPGTPVMAFLTEATPTHELGSMKDPLPSKTTMLPLSITPDTASKGVRTLAPWSVTRLEMSPPPCRSVRTFTVNSQIVSLFHPPGTTYRCPFTAPFDGFRSTVGPSSGFTTDSPAPESTVISRYRPRLPSVSTG